MYSYRAHLNLIAYLMENCDSMLPNRQFAMPYKYIEHFARNLESVYGEFSVMICYVYKDLEISQFSEFKLTERRNVSSRHK